MSHISDSSFGASTFFSGTAHPSFQWSSHCPLEAILLKMMLAGLASSGPDSCRSLAGSLPSTKDLVFLPDFIVSHTSHYSIYGMLQVLIGAFSTVLTLSCKFSTLSGSYCWLIAEK